MHAPQVLKARIRTSVFVNERVSETNSEDSRQGLPLPRRYADIYTITEASDEAGKPLARLYRDVVPTSSQNKQPVEPLQEFFRPPSLADEPFSFCAPDFSLRGVLVQIPKKFTQSRLKIEPVKTERGTLFESTRHNGFRNRGTKLNVLPLLPLLVLLQGSSNATQISEIQHQRMAVVGKR